jgi:hypothetical protein
VEAAIEAPAGDTVMASNQTRGSRIHHQWTIDVLQEDQEDHEELHLKYQVCCGSGSGAFFIPWIRDPDPKGIFPGTQIPIPAGF